MFTAILLILIGWTQAPAVEVEKLDEGYDLKEEPVITNPEHSTDKKKIPFLWQDRPIREHMIRL